MMRVDEWLLKERIDELGRLGDTLGIARERVTGGMGEQNHWGSWQASEEEIRITFAPLAETICGAVTKAYLRPMLRASGESLVGPNGGRLIAWYDVSELTARPDKSDPAIQLYDRLEISGTALRRETGFDEADAPTPDELGAMVWKKVAGSVELAPTSVAELSGVETPAIGGVPPAAASEGGTGQTSPGSPTSPVAGPPRTIANPPPAPGAGVPAMAASAAIRHVLDDAGLLDARRPRRYNGVHRPVRR